jgi:ATP-dependent Clp protease ATP-binding subunit ClpB
MREARKKFEPAFLGRLDDVVAFRPLTNTELLGIFDLELGRLRARLAQEFPLEFTPSPEARDFIFRRATDHPELGARLIKEKVEHYLRGPLSQLINSGQVAKGDRVFVDTDPGGKELSFSKKPLRTR